MEDFTQCKAGLYVPELEHDNCGIGAVVDIYGRKSYRTLDDALKIVEHLEHRAGKDAEGKTGDGVGVLTQISHKFFAKADARSRPLPWGRSGEYGIGMFFFPQAESKRNQAKKLFEIICKKESLPFLGWREVPICPEILGHKARSCMPQHLAGLCAETLRVPAGIDFDRRLYVARRVFEQSSQETMCAACPAERLYIKVCSGEGAASVLPGPSGHGLRNCHRHGSQPVLHQHRPQLEPGPPQPVHSPQRRNQHHPGQRGPPCWPVRRPWEAAT